MERNHPDDIAEEEFMCFDEAPIGDRLWSYDCDYCRLKFSAAWFNGELNFIPDDEMVEILKGFDNDRINGAST